MQKPGFSPAHLALHSGVAGLYDLLWLCNQALFFASLGCIFGAPNWIASCCGAVAFSHVSWNADVLLYWCGLGMPFGTGSYLLWPQTSWTEILTTSMHHVWMIPLLAYTLRREWGLRFHFMHMVRGMLLPFFLVPLCFYITPKEYLGVYLNINMSHEFWPASAFQFLTAFDASHNLFLAMWIVSCGFILNCAIWPVVLLLQLLFDLAFGLNKSEGTSSSKKKKKKK